MTDRERTPRGFVVFGRVTDSRGSVLRVQESSIAFEGPRAWLFLENSDQAAALSVEQAEQLAALLRDFTSAARANELTEPYDA